MHTGFPGDTVVKNLTFNAGGIRDQGSVGPGRFPGVENDNPVQYSCLENLIERGAWWATVSGVTGVDTLQLSTHACRQYPYMYIPYSVR